VIDGATAVVVVAASVELPPAAAFDIEVVAMTVGVAIKEGLITVSTMKTLTRIR
jgi:hypothetical protein